MTSWSSSRLEIPFSKIHLNISFLWKSAPTCNVPEKDTFDWCRILTISLFPPATAKCAIVFPSKSLNSKLAPFNKRYLKHFIEPKKAAIWRNVGHFWRNVRHSYDDGESREFRSIFEWINKFCKSSIKSFEIKYDAADLWNSYRRWSRNIFQSFSLYLSNCV